MSMLLGCCRALEVGHLGRWRQCSGVSGHFCAAGRGGGAAIYPEQEQDDGRAVNPRPTHCQLTHFTLLPLAIIVVHCRQMVEIGGHPFQGPVRRTFKQRHADEWLTLQRHP